jgi:hypothetical protein
MIYYTFRVKCHREEKSHTVGARDRRQLLDDVARLLLCPRVEEEHMHEVIVTIEGRPSVRARVDSLEDAARLAAAVAMASEIRPAVRVRLPDGHEIVVDELLAARRC